MVTAALAICSGQRKTQTVW